MTVPGEAKAEANDASVEVSEFGNATPEEHQQAVIAHLEAQLEVYQEAVDRAEAWKEAQLARIDATVARAVAKRDEASARLNEAMGV